MKKDKFIPNAPIFANLKNRGVTCACNANTKNKLEKARRKGLIIFEPALNYGVKEYSQIVKRRQKYNK